MKRCIFNETLLNRVGYSNIGSLRKILNTWRTLENLSEKGDQVALSIMIDLKTALGKYKTPTLLSPEEIFLIKNNLIYGVSQGELARERDVTPKTISERIKKGLKKISKILEGGNDD